MARDFAPRLFESRYESVPTRVHQPGRVQLAPLNIRVGNLFALDKDTAN